MSRSRVFRLVTEPFKILALPPLGVDKTVVDAARASFGRFGGKKKKYDMSDCITFVDHMDPTLTKEDERLLRYLASKGHLSPFRHVFQPMVVEAHEAFMRQLFRYVTGSCFTSGMAATDVPWNEASTRYMQMNKVYVRDVFHRQSETAKQGASEAFDDAEQVLIQQLFATKVQLTMRVYDELLDMGVAREEARGLLPLNFVTRVYWTPSLQALLNLYQQRSGEGAQEEMREFADAISHVLFRNFPHAWGALLAHIK